MSGEQVANELEIAEKSSWLKVTYHFHVFHYRMPQSAAIAAVTPFVPSPLTVKMAMIASLFQLGDIKGAEIIGKNIHKIEVKIVPPKAALSFKPFLRYRSPPAVESEEKGLDETGSYYPSRPHMREYALFQGVLDIYVMFPKDIIDYGKKALKNVRYLGCKDSLVTCVDLREENFRNDVPSVSKLKDGKSGVVVLLVDFKPGTEVGDILQLIPGNREEKMCETTAYTIPGTTIATKGRTKILKKTQQE